MELNMEILVIFKTHLDLGYTDLATNVEKRYMEDFIPHALELAETMRGCGENFVWTTGSWLIDRFLATSPDAPRMERAIKDRLISWHALPFTMHVEMMDAPLYEYGLSISKRLDEQFGRKTIAAKSTDVPGFTRAAVPLLAKAGVKLIHIGVNPVSAVPELPPIFRWRVDGSEIIVIYDKNYGDRTVIPGTDKLLCFAMTGDNNGPQTPSDIEKIYADLRAEYPGATIRSTDLNEIAEIILAADPELPSFEGEIGDSWDHGYQSDPRKQMTYRAMLRYAENLPETQRDSVYSELLKVAEHTCGLCGKRYINDDGNYVRADFESARSTGKYALAEQSWQEQRNYVTSAIASLDAGLESGARSQTNAWRSELAPITPARLEVGKPFELGELELSVGNDGSVFGLKCGENALPSWQRLFRVEYEIFSHADTLRFGEQYFKLKTGWGYDDFTKVGLDESPNSHILASAHLERLYRLGDSVILHMSFEPCLHEKYGCPSRFTLRLNSENGKLCGDLAWFDKPASRIPEGIWLTFDGNSDDPELSVRKLGCWIDPRTTVKNGGRSLHGTDFGIRAGGLEIETLDCSLVSFGGGLWDFSNRLPREGDPIRFCLYNNQWSTNFPFWYDEDARFRFKVGLK